MPQPWRQVSLTLDGANAATIGAMASRRGIRFRAHASTTYYVNVAGETATADAALNDEVIGGGTPLAYLDDDAPTGSISVFAGSAIVIYYEERGGRA